MAFDTSEPVTRTKLHAPAARTPNVERRALLSKLTSHRGIVLIVAPPGSGKTTLLGQWQREDDRPFGWITLDPGDNDPAVLLSYLSVAVRSLSGADTADAPPPESRQEDASVLPRLLDRFDELTRDPVLVLDDLHWISDPSCLELLERLIQRVSPRVTIALAARAVPPLPMAQLRVTTDFLEVSSADLAFTLTEADELLNHILGLGLGPAAIRSLWDRTEGWPAALYLAYLSMRDAPDPETFVAQFSGTSRHVVDYLTEVVLGGQEAEVRDFLLRTSVLERMSGPLCDHLLEATGSAERLVALERANLLIVPLDDHREWYRYHRLFVEQLRDELVRSEPGDLPVLHERAARWLADAGETGEAIRHSLAAGDVEQAAELVSRSYLGALEGGRLATIANWLDAFPRELISSDARLAVTEAWLLNFQGRYAEADLAMETARRTGYGGPLPDGAASLDASAALLRASTPRDDVGEMLRAAHDAYELEARSASLWRVTTQVQLGWALLLAGELEAARTLLEQAALEAPRSDQWLNAFGARCLLAWLSLQERRDVEAERWALDATEVMEEHGFADSAAGDWGLATLGAVRADQGRFKEASELLSRGLERMRAQSPPLLLAAVLMTFARVQRAQDHRLEAKALLDESRAIIQSSRDPGVLREELARTARRLASSDRHAPRAASLSERELEVLRLLERGMSEREIARTLFLSFHTIHSHTRSIYRKLGAVSRPDAIERAREHGLV